MKNDIYNAVDVLGMGVAILGAVVLVTLILG